MESSKPRMIVTSALPYVNGSIHLGHMVEYIQTDIFVRFQRLIGTNVVYCCAGDTHGTPIEVNARKQGISPEELVAKYHTEHQKDFADFLISFDSYHSTNSPENKHFAELVFKRLQDAGYIYKKKVEQLYCAACKRFLPDRYVKGTCPKCGAEDQYGDICEKCGNTHEPTELKDAKCVLSGDTPVLKETEHYFFKLSDCRDQLKAYFEGRNFQKEVMNFLNQWLDDLNDWCISRDGPYFGFKIPGEDDKYFYVWLDAPIGYISSYAHLVEGDVAQAEKDWNNSKIIHFIGKDITYFHFLFWPAMLTVAGFTVPDHIFVHGFLTVNKEKMSKSRGTFITARKYLDHLNPEHLRYYFASHLTSKLTDLNFDTHDFKEKVNNELVANIANLAYRVLSFTNKNFNGELSTIGSDFNEAEITSEFTKAFDRIKAHYAAVEFREAIKELLYLSSLGNKYFQDAAPWELIKTNPDQARQVLTFAVNLVRNINILLYPILPEFSEALQKQLNSEFCSWEELGFSYENVSIAKAKIIFTKIENEVDNLVVEQEHLFPALIKVGEIVEAKEHPNADKLYVEQINIGSETLQIVSGLRDGYPDVNELVGKKVAVLCNLASAKLRGVESQGMVLVAEDTEGKYVLVEAKNSKPGDVIYADKKVESLKEIDFKTFGKVEIKVQNKHLLFEGHELKTDAEVLKVDMPNGSMVR